MDVKKEALNAVRKLLSDNFTTIKKIYITNIPENFERHSFLVEPQKAKTSRLTKYIIEHRLPFKIVYFPIVDEVENVKDKMAQIAIEDKLELLFSELRSIESPDGYIFNLLEDFSIDSTEIIELDISLQTTVSRSMENPDDEMGASVKVTFN